MTTPITDPELPADQRLRLLEAVAVGLSPMHPATWDAIQAERAAIEGAAS